MEFWGAEVQPGKSFYAGVRKGQVLHISQAIVGDIIDSSSNIYLHITFDGKQYVCGTLHSERFPHQTFDLLFNKSVTISHTSEHSSVYFYGYTTENLGYENGVSSVRVFTCDHSQAFDTLGEEDKEECPPPVASSGKAKKEDSDDDDEDNNEEHRSSVWPGFSYPVKVDLLHMPRFGKKRPNEAASSSANKKAKTE